MPVIDPLVLVRGLHFAATLWAAGTVGFIVLVGAPSRQLRVIAGAALGLSVLSGLVWFVLIAARILDAPLTGMLDDGGVWAVAAGTRFGQVAIARLALAAALGLLLASGRFEAIQLAVAAAFAGLLALTGHAGATPGLAGWLHLASDAVHVLAAAAWLGALPALALNLSAANAAATAVAVAARFSTLGIACVGALLATGLINSWNLLDGPGDLAATAYGRVLSLKLVLFAFMVAVAAVNRHRLTPRLPAAAPIRALRRNTLIETGLGLAVLMLAGLLGTMVPGGHVHTNAAAPPSEAAFVHIHTEEVMADVTIDPGHAGRSTATIRLSQEDGRPSFARSVQMTLAPHAFSAPAIERKAAPGPDGTWLIENLAISQAGVWTLRLDIDTGAGAPVALDAPIVITQCSNECW